MAQSLKKKRLLGLTASTGGGGGGPAPDPIRRHTAQPWNAPVAYAPSTAYEAGQRVINAGKIYEANNGGTSGASSAPTGTGVGRITDNTISWYYIGLAFTSDPAAPPFSVSASAPVSPPKFYRNSAGTFSSGATTVVSNDTWFEFTGAPSGLGTGGFCNFVAGARKARVAFKSAIDDTIIIAKANAAGYGMMVAIENRYLIDGAVPQSGSSGTSYTSIAVKADDLVEIFWNGDSNSAPLKGVYCSAGNTLTAPLPSTRRILAFTDSYGLNTNSGTHIDLGMFGVMGDLMDTNDVYIEGVGGSGFVAGGVNNFLSTTRLGRINSYAPNLVIAMCSINDVADITTNLNTWVTEVRSRAPTADILILGMISRSNGSETTREAEARVAVAAIRASGDTKVYHLPVSANTARPCITGTGRDDAPTSVGNADIYWSPDNTHPNSRGYPYIGNWLGIDPTAQSLAA